MVTGAIEQALSPLYQWIPLERFNVCDVTIPFPVVALFPSTTQNEEKETETSTQPERRRRRR